MTFFTASDDEEEPEIPAEPPWMGPPTLMFSGILPANRVLAEGDKGAVVLTLIRAFGVGCQFEISATIARPARHADRAALFEDIFGHRRTPGEALPAGLLRFGVEYPDGRTTTTLARHPSTITEEPPEPPVLAISGGYGRMGGSAWMEVFEPLWLWTLPPAEQFDLVIEWPAAGIGETRVPMDGAAIAEAAARESRPFGDRFRD